MVGTEQKQMRLQLLQRWKVIRLPMEFFQSVMLNQSNVFSLAKI